MVTVLAVADEVSPLLYDHFSPEKWKSIDLVLSCGDLPPELLDLLGTTLRVPVLYVRGNHDGKYEGARYDGFENLHGRLLEVNGLRVAGLEGSRRYSTGDCQYTEEEMERVVRRVDKQVRRMGVPDIVISHAAPAGIHDADDICHQGFECFRRAIERWQPAYFVHGHMHNYTNAPQVSLLGNTTVMNACQYRVFETSTKPRLAEPKRNQLLERMRMSRKRIRPAPGAPS